MREIRRRLRDDCASRVAPSGNRIAVTKSLTITVHRDVVDLEQQLTGDTISMAPDELKEVIEGLAWAAGQVAVEEARRWEADVREANKRMAQLVEQGKKEGRSVTDIWAEKRRELGIEPKSE